MDSKQAITYIDRLVGERGKMAAIEYVASGTNTKWETVYAWWRRGKVPDWRLPALLKLAKRKTR